MVEKLVKLEKHWLVTLLVRAQRAKLGKHWLIIKQNVTNYAEYRPEQCLKTALFLFTIFYFTL